MSHLDELTAALQRPDVWPHRPAEVEIVRTHISILFFAGDRVFKLKQPVDMGFLDYTTLDKRRFYCAEEVRLNRRLAKDTYHGIRPIVRDSGGEIHPASSSFDPERPEAEQAERDAADDGEIIDYAVEMTRLPAHRLMDHLLDEGAIDHGRITAIANLIADFHERCATGDDVNEHAVPDEIRRQVTENLDGLAEHAGDIRKSETAVLSEPLLESIRRWCQQQLDAHRGLMQRRVDEGRVREGHGDLHAGNICLLDDRIVIYDCIEFTRAFRCRDVACELAFLAMDLDGRGFRGFSGALVRQYVDRTGDAELTTLLDFYKVHLALVRSKVAALKAAGEGLSDEQREQAIAEARRYALLAATYVIGPAVVVMCGLPATGKSTIARAIAEPYEAVILRSDVVRKQLAGLEPTQRVPDDRVDEIYSDAFTERVYGEVAERAAEALRHGRAVVLDAMHPTATSREASRRIADQAGVPAVLIHARATDSAIHERMAQRAGDRSEVSDADWQVYQRARQRFEPPDEWPDETRVDADPDEVEAAVQDAVERLAAQSIPVAQPHSS